MQHLMHVYEDDKHWDTHIIYKYLNYLEIYHITLSDLEVQLAA